MNAPRRPARSSSTPSFIEQLEARQLLSASVSGEILTVTGGAKADKITITVKGSNIVVKQGRTTKNFARSGVKQLIVNGNNGNDKIGVAGPIPNVVINGGAGNDILLGTGGADLISGGSGRDKLFGRKGDDQIYGDDGDDELHGGDGNDTLGGDDEDILTANTGGVGNDKLFGEGGVDWLLSGQESDEITDPSGADEFSGGAGNKDVVDARGRNEDDLETSDGDDDVIKDSTEDNIVPTDDVTGTLDPVHPEESYTHHKHAFIKIFLEDKNGNKTLVNIPSHAGEFFAQPVVHTHDNPNPLDVRGFLMHFHNTDDSGGAARVMTLGDFFQHWGISLSSKNLGRLRVDQKHTLTMKVKPKGGAQITPPDGQNFNNYVIQTPDGDGSADQGFDQIEIIYKTIA